MSGKLEVSKNSFQIIHPLNIINKNNINNYEYIYPEYDLSRKKINKKIFRSVINKNINLLTNNQFLMNGSQKRL